MPQCRTTTSLSANRVSIGRSSRLRHLKHAGPGDYSGRSKSGAYATKAGHEGRHLAGGTPLGTDVGEIVEPIVGRCDQQADQVFGLGDFRELVPIAKRAGMSGDSSLSSCLCTSSPSRLGHWRNKFSLDLERRVHVMGGRSGGPGRGSRPEPAGLCGHPGNMGWIRCLAA